MKNSAKALIAALVFTATAFAETAPTQSAWSVYTAKGDHVVMLQATAVNAANEGAEMGKQAKLDVICKNGKLSAIALEPAAALRKGAVSFTGTLPTTRVGLVVNNQAPEFENWAVTDHGRTLTPYSEAFQSKRSSRWMERMISTSRLSFAVETVETAEQPTFETGQLSEALSSVGCSY